MTEGGHRRRAPRRGRLSGVPLDQFRADLLGLVSAKVQQCVGLEDVRREGYGKVTVTVQVQGHDFVWANVSVDHTSKPGDG